MMQPVVQSRLQAAMRTDALGQSASGAAVDSSEGMTTTCPSAANTYPHPSGRAGQPGCQSDRHGQMW